MFDTPPDLKLVRRFVAALILRTLLDALNGDAESASFMDQEAPDLARRVLHMHSAPIRAWRQIRLFGLTPKSDLASV
jgi:hypothetical protein